MQYNIKVTINKEVYNLPYETTEEVFDILNSNSSRTVLDLEYPFKISRKFFPAIKRIFTCSRFYHHCMKTLELGFKDGIFDTKTVVEMSNLTSIKKFKKPMEWYKKCSHFISIEIFLISHEIIKFLRDKKYTWYQLKNDTTWVIESI